MVFQQTLCLSNLDPSSIHELGEVNFIRTTLWSNFLICVADRIGQGDRTKYTFGKKLRSVWRDHRLGIKRPASDDISEKGEKQICFDFLSTPFFTLNRNISVQFSVCLNNCLKLSLKPRLKCCIL
jgi:hypothetical protein